MFGSTSRYIWNEAIHFFILLHIQTVIIVVWCAGCCMENSFSVFLVSTSAPFNKKK